MTDLPANLFQLLSAQRDGDEAARAEVLAPVPPWLRLLARLQIDREFQGKFDPSDIPQQAILEAYRDLLNSAANRSPSCSPGCGKFWVTCWVTKFAAIGARCTRDLSREVSLEQSLAQSSLRIGSILADDGPSPSQRAVARKQEVRLAEVLGRLPEEYREVIVLRNLEELPHEEIARRMGRSVGAVRMLWLRALAELRSEIVDISGPTSRSDNF